MSRVSSCALLAVVLVAALGPGGGLLRADEAEFGIQVGALFPDDEISNGDSQTEPLVGLRGSYRFTDHWGWMLDLWFAEVGAVDPAVTPAMKDDAPTVAIRSGVELLFGPRERRHRWFVNLGGGLIDFDLARDSVNRTFASVGAGNRLTFGEQRYLRWEIRADQTLDDDGFRGETLLNPQFLIGMSWGVGGNIIDDDHDGVADRKDDCPGTLPGARVDGRGCAVDSDGDGVPDGIDRCPRTPAGWPIDDDGCPTDSDGDGVPDATDDCPDTPRGATVDQAGCPSDSDGDGVLDGIDRCAGTPRGARVDASGCPSDSDGDGVVDGIDACAGTPAGATVDGRGCPQDSDGDGVPDGIDACPGTPAGRAVDARGCEAVTRVVLEPVLFPWNQAQLLPQAAAVLDRAVVALRAAPGLRLELGGHTDNTGEELYNRWLATSRAEGVRDYLVSKGIAAERLTIHSYGAAKPRADNGTPEGRRLNRRVEFTPIE